MSKLYFRHGSVSSGKTMHLLGVWHNYLAQGKKVVLIKPSIDVRDGKRTVKSRCGTQAEADILIENKSDGSAELDNFDFTGIDCILVDESQFLEPAVIDRLQAIAKNRRIPCLCYGLRTDFKTHLFPASKRLMEICDTIEEIKTTCFYCNKKSIFNLKFVDGKATIDGPSVELGKDERYKPACWSHYILQLDDQAARVSHLES